MVWCVVIEAIREGSREVAELYVNYGAEEVKNGVATEGHPDSYSRDNAFNERPSLLVPVGRVGPEGIEVENPATMDRLRTRRSALREQC